MAPKVSGCLLTVYFAPCFFITVPGVPRWLWFQLSNPWKCSSSSCLGHLTYESAFTLSEGLMLLGYYAIHRRVLFQRDAYVYAQYTCVCVHDIFMLWVYFSFLIFLHSTGSIVIILLYEPWTFEIISFILLSLCY